VDKRFYMAAIDVTGRRCLVVGGGPVAAEKAAGLAACGAIVKAVAPELSDELSALPVDWREGRYRTGDLDGCFLVVAATSDRAVNEQVYADAEARGLLCNVADVPELCSFILPAVHREGPITVAVSTGGASPALAKRLRTEIAELVQPRHAELARALEALRPEAKQRFATYEERRDYFEEIVRSRLS